MSRNYDTTQPTPYPRVARLELNFDEQGNVSALYIEKMAVALQGADDQRRVMYIEGTESRHQIDIQAAAMNEPIPMVHPVTDAPLGKNTTAGEAYLSVLAVIRANQKKIDAANAGT